MACGHILAGTNKTINHISTAKTFNSRNKNLRVEPKSKLEPDLVSSEVSIVFELELELIKISIRILRIVLVFSLIYQ
jgi:hypothetical protein